MNHLVYIAYCDNKKLISTNRSITYSKKQISILKSKYNTMCYNVSEAKNLSHLSLLVFRESNFMQEVYIKEDVLNIRNRALYTRERIYNIYLDACTNRNIIANKIVELENKLQHINIDDIKHLTYNSRKKAVISILESTISVVVLSNIVVSYL